MQELKTDEALQSFKQTGRVVVEFYTSWCPDCKRVEPFLDEWGDRFQQEFAMARGNSEYMPSATETFDIRGIPTFLAFEDGVLVNRLYSRDAKSKAQVETFLERAFDAPEAK